MYSLLTSSDDTMEGEYTLLLYIRVILIHVYTYHIYTHIRTYIDTCIHYSRPQAAPWRENTQSCYTSVARSKTQIDSAYAHDRPQQQVIDVSLSLSLSDFAENLTIFYPQKYCERCLSRLRVRRCCFEVGRVLTPPLRCRYDFCVCLSHHACRLGSVEFLKMA
jgi:hypothetical protein